MSQQPQYSYGYAYGYGHGGQQTGYEGQQTGHGGQQTGQQTGYGGQQTGYGGQQTGYGYQTPAMSQPQAHIAAGGYAPYQAPQLPTPQMAATHNTVNQSAVNPYLQQGYQQAQSGYYGYQQSYPNYYPQTSSQGVTSFTATTPRGLLYTPTPVTTAIQPPSVSYPIYRPSTIPTYTPSRTMGPSTTLLPLPSTVQSSSTYNPSLRSVPPPISNQSTPSHLTDRLSVQQQQVVAQYVANKNQGSVKGGWWNKKSVGVTKAQEFYCDVCKISAASEGTYQTHLEGKLHKKKLTQQKLISTVDKKFNKFYCELCDVVCSNSDSLEAHSRGTKHQKVLNLHRRLGKPIPTLKVELSGLGNGKKVLAGPHRLMFVGGQTLHSTNEDNSEPSSEVKVYPPVVEIPTPAQPTTPTVNSPQQQSENESETVGEHLVVRVTGDQKFLNAQFKCEMCDCYFNDEFAKKAHIKGRRHRLNFKKMYQPDLYIEPTGAKKKEIERKKLKRKERVSDQSMGPTWKEDDDEEASPDTLEEWDGGWDITMSPDPNHDPHDDILVMDRHKLIYPLGDEMAAIDKVVSDVETALKAISDDLMKEKAASSNENTSNETFRDLKGVMRVGAYAHSLLLKDDCSVELVLMCDKKPTVTLFNLVMSRLAVRFELMLGDSNDNVYNINPTPGKSSVTLISQIGPHRVTVSVVLTSPLMRDTPTSVELQAELSEGVLCRQYCVAALAALRHTKWFKAMSQDTPTSSVLVRVLKDMCRRIPVWRVLDTWMLELLVQKCALSCLPDFRQPGDLFRRVMECVGSGIFLPGGRGVLDPCEKEPTDVCAPLSANNRARITLSAQHALRLISFRKLHLVLGVEPLVKPTDQSAYGGVKRGAPGDYDQEPPTKKSKIE